MRAGASLHPALVKDAALRAAKARFEGRALVWGKDDCAHLVAFGLKQMGLKPSLAKFGAYASPQTALRRLKAQGFTALEDAVDAVAGLKRTPFAFATPGDVVALESEGWVALGFYLSTDKALAFGETPAGLVCAVGAMLQVPLITWKVTCPPPR